MLVISLWTHTPSSLAALSIVFTSAACAARAWDAAARPRRASPTELGPWRHRDRRHRTALVPLRRRLAPVCQDKPWSGDSDDEAFEEDDDEE